MHVSHIRRPSVAPYVPATHGLHEGEAVASANVPAAHETHGSPSSELAPAAHASHEMLPLSADSRPGGQRMQASPSEPTPKPSGSLLRRVTYDPAVHVSHSAAPSEPL